MLDLYHATSDDLIRTILEQRNALAARDRQIAVLRDGQAALGQVVKELTVQVGDLRAAAIQERIHRFSARRSCSAHGRRQRLESSRSGACRRVYAGAARHD